MEYCWIPLQTTLNITSCTCTESLEHLTLKSGQTVTGTHQVLWCCTWPGVRDLQTDFMYRYMYMYVWGKPQHEMQTRVTEGIIDGERKGDKEKSNRKKHHRKLNDTVLTKAGTTNTVNIVQTTHIPIVESKNTFTAYHPGNGMETGLVFPHLSSFPCGVHRTRDSVRTTSHKSTMSIITQSVNMYGGYTYYTCTCTCLSCSY